MEDYLKNLKGPTDAELRAIEREEKDIGILGITEEEVNKIEASEYVSKK